MEKPRSVPRHVARTITALATLLVAACGGAEPTPRTLEAATPASPAPAPPATAATEAAAEPPDSASSSGDAAAPAAAKTASAPKDDRPRIGALGPHTWIYKKPAFVKPAIGKMRPGTSVVLKSATPVPGEGCARGWYAIEPRGFVCLDATSTLDLEDSYYRALAFASPEPGVWPYRYAYSRDTPMYSRIPTPEEWAKVEAKYRAVGKHEDLGKWAHSYEELNTDEPIRATDPVPYFLQGGKRTAGGGNYSNEALVWRRAPNGVILSYARAFEAHGRVWLLTPDTMVVPAERTENMRRSDFHGVKLAEAGVELPFGWNRSKEPLPLYVKEGDAFVTSGTIPPKSWVTIVDAPEKQGDMAYFPLRDRPGVYLGKTTKPEKQLDQPVSITRVARKLPNGVSPGERWIEIKIRPGTLTAYEGMTPVFTTLFSPGKGGPPVPGLDHEKYMTTAVGWFPIEWKEKVATMSSEPGEPVIQWYTDVPNQQYLRAPLAMHNSLWHEDFGKRKSKECVNVAPRDGDFLFGWTAPALPEGWNAIGPGWGNGKSTPVVSTAD